VSGWLSVRLVKCPVGTIFEGKTLGGRREEPFTFQLFQTFRLSDFQTFNFQFEERNSENELFEESLGMTSPPWVGDRFPYRSFNFF
jgi:hypothetical protein